MDEKKQQEIRADNLTQIYTVIDETFLDISEEKRNAAKEIFAQESDKKVNNAATYSETYGRILSDSELTKYLIRDARENTGIQTTPEALLEIYFHLSPETQITQNDIVASEYIYDNGYTTMADFYTAKREASTARADANAAAREAAEAKIAGLESQQASHQAEQ